MNYKRGLTSLVLIAALAIGGWRMLTRTQVKQVQAAQKVYVALEGSGEIAVLDAQRMSLLYRIDLGVKDHGKKTGFMPHNVQVAPDGSSVWVTANAHAEGHGHAMGSTEEEVGHPDELIQIDPQMDKIIKRIPLGEDMHVSHVVISSDGKKVYALSQEKDLLIEVDAKNGTVARRIELGDQVGPHGLRLSPDDKYLFIALLTGRGLAIVETATGQKEKINLPGQAVQTAVTPDGRYAAVTLYDAKRVALYRVENKELRFVDLPDSAKGPVQLYPTPDSKYLYVADQGFYFDQPTSEWVYKIDVDQGKVIKEIRAGKGPHGVVVSSDGARVYITNLVSDDVSVIDTSTDAEMTRISVGDMPNGISLWSEDKQ